MDESRYAALRGHLKARFGVLYVVGFGDGSTLGAALALLQSMGLGGIFASLAAILVQVAAGSIDGLSLGPVIFVRDTLPPQARAAVLVHEVTHSAQVSAIGLFTYLREYAGSQERRAAYEAGACVAAAELLHALDGSVPSPVVQVSHGYLLDGEQVAFGVALGEQARVAIEGGVYTQPVSRDAVAFLRGLDS